MPECKRVVLSGGPGTGKTVVIQELIKRGFTCNLEISREIIQQELGKGTDILPWANLPAFSQKVIEGRMEQFRNAKPGINFYDRSIVDSIAYMHKDHLKSKKEWLDFLDVNPYHNQVFITAPWKEIFENDHERRESWGQLLQLHEYIVSTYQDFGYEAIFIPQLSITERTDFVLENVQ